MEFRIADTFADSLARLPAQEQKAAKTSAFDLQMNPAAPGLQFHRIDKSRDSNFWSIRVSRDLRIIVHRTRESMLLAYVDHHDRVYNWAERRRIEAHPKTGAIQIVEVRERVEEIAPELPLEPLGPRPSWPQAGGTPALPGSKPEPVAKLCFNVLTADQLLSVGVPPDWLDDVLGADEDRFLAVADHLPSEAAEALLEYVTTGMLPVPAPVAPADAMYAHPDALRRFRVIETSEELRLALEYPWDKWMVYLHPSQRETIEKSYAGPARVAGSAGTGKTVVTLHRAARLAKDSPAARVLLTTFSRPLADMLERKLKILLGTDLQIVPRIIVTPFHGVAEELYQLGFGRRPHIASPELIRSIITKAADANGLTGFPLRFLVSEWANVVDAWQLAGEDAYADVPRLGRKNRMSVKQRARLWPVFRATRDSLAQKGSATWSQVLGELTALYAGNASKPFTHIVVDEAQDLGVAELRFLAAIAPTGADSLFFAGDLGQRIFQQPFSWLTLGVDVRGRSQTLKVNYRTSHQIREAADRLLPKVLRDVDGLEERRAGTVSVFNGPEPIVGRFETPEVEIAAVGEWIAAALNDGFAPSEIGVFVRDYDQLDRARAAVKAARQTPFVLSERDEDAGAHVSVGTMHLAKGLEFKAVAVMACDDEVLPLQARVAAVADEVELDDVYETERQLFYVACTRARDRLMVSGETPASEFLGDLESPPTRGR
ncbi:MAG TPA: 3'-5' exonuclease [Rhizomicrobium sp.]